MPQRILMPALSPTMEKGNLAKWHVKEGDAVKPGSMLAEIETDKAMMEFEAIDPGSIYKILVAEKTEDVPVNTPIAILREKNDTDEAMAKFLSEAPKQEASKVAVKEEVSSPKRDLSGEAQAKGERIYISPLAKRIAEQKNIPIDQLNGTGPKGRIVRADVENYQPKTTQKAAGAFETVPMSSMRKVIAKRLTESKQNIPHFYASIDCDVTNLLQLRERINSKIEAKLTINDFILKIMAACLIKHPKLNATFHGDHIQQYSDVDIAVAVSLEEGLITPIVRQCQNKTLQEISHEVKDLAKRAKEGRLKPEEYQGGGISISNMGMFGIREFYAIINPPQVAILAIGAAKNNSLIVTMSADHRAVDGTDVARFLKTFKEYIEDPMMILV